MAKDNTPEHVVQEMRPKRRRFSADEKICIVLALK